MAKELLVLGVSYKNMKKYEEAMESYEKSIKLLERLNDKPGIGAALNNMGLLHISMGNWTKARRSIDRSLKLLKNDELERARVLLNLGGLLEGRERIKDAVKAYEESLALFKNMKSGEAVKAYLRLGDVHLSGGNHREALKCFIGAMNLHRSLPGPRLKRRESRDAMTARIDARLIEVYREMSNWSSCAEVLTRDIERLKAKGDDARLAMRLLELGLVFENMGLLEKAAENLQKAQVILERRKDHRGLVATALNLGRITRKAGDEKGSKGFFKKALGRARKIRDKAGAQAASSELKKF